ncbi:MAG: LysR family transcriptional regulator [Rhodobacteraceae bacterium]|nr:LysR family transcriptional regulator [Paracoccaceae bacterium]
MNKPFKPAAPILELDLLKTLVAIAETGNFSSAAEVVFRTPSAVSMQIKRMEEMLGRSLFDRDSRSVTLTEHGEALLVHARRVLALNHQIVAQFITPEVSGTVRLGAVDHVVDQFLPVTLRRFAQSHPGVRVDVTVEQTDTLLQMVERGQLDIALVTRCTDAAEKAKGEILCREQLVWAGLKGGIAAEQTPLPISVWQASCEWHHAALKGLSEQQRNFHITFKTSHIAAQKAAILADLAIAPLPLSACSGKVVALGSEHGLPPLPDFAIGMVIASQSHAPVCAVANHFRAKFAS